MNKPKYREMKKAFALAVICLSACLSQAQPLYQDEDTAIFRQWMQYADTGNREITQVALFFTDTPYEGGTLEGDSAERLRINLRRLDCFTFVENVIAFHRLLQGDDPSFGRFCEILQYIRYRGGILNGYLSRLHYTGEWLYDNQQKGVLQLPVLRESEPFHPSVSFMSAHCDRYPALKDHPDRRLGIRQIEDRVSRLPLRFIPKERLTSATDIRDGDVIAITTHIKGLDVSHVGFALCRNGVPFLLHASSEAGKVVVGVEPLHRYLAQRKNHSGVIVARSGRPERFK